MKYLTTNKQLKFSHNLIAAGYCELQNALEGVNPSAYTESKMYGWRADVYDLEHFTVVTGYSTPTHAIDLPYDLCRKIESYCRGKSLDVRLAILQLEVKTHLDSIK